MSEIPKGNETNETFSTQEMKESNITTAIEFAENNSTVLDANNTSFPLDKQVLDGISDTNGTLAAKNRTKKLTYWNIALKILSELGDSFSELIGKDYESINTSELEKELMKVKMKLSTVKENQAMNPSFESQNTKERITELTREIEYINKILSSKKEQN